MKKYLPFLIMSLCACSKKPAEADYPVEDSRPAYDTVAIDSFSTGAASADVAKKIKMSSKTYQDSLKAAQAAVAKSKAESEKKDDKNETPKKSEAVGKEKDLNLPEEK